MEIIKPITHQKFLRDIDVFCTAFGFSARAFGVAVMNDTTLVFRLRAGKSPTLSRIEQVYDFMIEHAGAIEKKRQVDLFCSKLGDGK